MMKVVPFEKLHTQIWDDFVAHSKNGSFLFLRDYMDYHADRFEDGSLLFYDGDHLIGLMPASRHGETVISHGGLTYGGVVSGIRMTMSSMLDIFAVMQDYLTGCGINKLIYKALPHIYHRYPAEEAIYALFRYGAQLYRVDVASTIDLTKPLAFSKGRKHSLAKARKNGLVVRKSDDYATYWKMIGHLLEEKYCIQPTHSLDEILLLAERFPAQIALYGTFQGADMLAGTVSMIVVK